MGGVFDEEVVDGDVEEFGELHDGFDRGRDLAVLVAADLVGQYEPFGSSGLTVRSGVYSEVVP